MVIGGYTVRLPGRIKSSQLGSHVLHDRTRMIGLTKPSESQIQCAISGFILPLSHSSIRRRSPIGSRDSPIARDGCLSSLPPSHGISWIGESDFLYELLERAITIAFGTCELSSKRFTRREISFCPQRTVIKEFPWSFPCKMRGRSFSTNNTSLSLYPQVAPFMSPKSAQGVVRQRHINDEG